MPENPIYEVRIRRELKPGYREKFVTIYCSPSGEEVSKEEATVELTEVVNVLGGGRSKRDREDAITKLCEVLPDPEVLGSADPSELVDEVQKALEKMATEPDLQFQIALKVATTSLNRVNRLLNNSDSGWYRGLHCLRWAIGLLAKSVKLLPKSDRKQAIESLTKLLDYSISMYVPFDEDDYAKPISDALKDVLRTLMEEDSEL